MTCKRKCEVPTWNPESNTFSYNADCELSGLEEAAASGELCSAGIAGCKCKLDSPRHPIAFRRSPLNFIAWMAFLFGLGVLAYAAGNVIWEKFSR